MKSANNSSAPSCSLNQEGLKFKLMSSRVTMSESARAYITNLPSARVVFVDTSQSFYKEWLTANISQAIVISATLFSRIVSNKPAICRMVRFDALSASEERTHYSNACCSVKITIKREVKLFSSRAWVMLSSTLFAACDEEHFNYSS